MSLPSSLLPPQQGTNSIRDIYNAKSSPEVQSSHYVKATVRPGSNAFAWAFIAQLESYELNGEHVGAYIKANRYGNAPVWGGCFEVQDATGIGALWGLEVDALSVGAPSGSEVRRGIGVVLGTAPVPNAARAHFYAAYDVVPLGFQPSAATLETAYHVGMPCENALAAPPGSWITLDRDKMIGLMFDETTGWLHMGIKGNPAFQFHMGTGEMRSRGRVIATAA